jgi:hypothetical protein
MPSRFVRLLATTALLWLSVVAVARAGFQDWSYTWQRDPFSVAANAGAKAGGASLLLPTLPPGGGAGASPIAPMVVLAGTKAEGTHDSPADLFQNAQYTVTLTVTDNQSSASHSFEFHGLLNGSMTTNLVHLTSSFVGGDQQSFTISGRLYTVTLNFVDHDAPASSFSGEVTASVEVGGQPPPAAMPEPASLMLAGFALPGIGLAAWRQWTRRRERSQASE